ncbi:MAG TPA: endo-1,4-beta-xylanase [Polyangiaceae bacterium]|nr:endo-1,4-beta-xylanase [Polyangiaceae bacterium]
MNFPKDSVSTSQTSVFRRAPSTLIFFLSMWAGSNGTVACAPGETGGPDGSAAGASGSSSAGSGGSGMAGSGGHDAGSAGGGGGGMAGRGGNGAGGTAGSSGGTAGTGTAGSGNTAGADGGPGGSGGAAGRAGDASIQDSGAADGGQDSAGGAGRGGAGGNDGAADAGDADATARDAGTDGPSVRPKFVGNITTSGAVRSDFIRYWDQITPENEGKWGSVEATRGTMNWAGLDAVYNYAQQQGIPFKQHTLVWGSQQPSWISSLSPSEQAAEVEEWIRLFCERYPNVALIDVVNEPPPHTTPPYMNAIGGAGSTGYDWIIWSFQKARQYCPRAILILNDYNILRWADADNFITIANAVKGSGYIDALGSQSHGQETQTLSDLQTRLNNLIAVGLPIYISEYDVSIQDDAQQQMIMEQQFTLFWNTPQIKGITLWGYVYGSTWSQAPYSGLIRNDTPRPAMTWLMNFLGR